MDHNLTVAIESFPVCGRGQKRFLHAGIIKICSRLGSVDRNLNFIEPALRGHFINQIHCFLVFLPGRAQSADADGSINQHAEAFAKLNHRTKFVQIVLFAQGHFFSDLVTAGFDAEADFVIPRRAHFFQSLFIQGSVFAHGFVFEVVQSGRANGLGKGDIETSFYIVDFFIKEHAFHFRIFFVQGADFFDNAVNISRPPVQFIVIECGRRAEITTAWATS